MKFIIKVSKYSLLRWYLILIFAAIPVTSSAQDIVSTSTTQVITTTTSSTNDIVDTSYPEDLVAAPTVIVSPPSTVQPDCHSYTGCDVMVVKKHIHHYYKHKHHRHYRIYHEPCDFFGGCCARPAISEYCY